MFLQRFTSGTLIYYMFAVFTMLNFIMPEVFRNISEYMFSVFGFLIWATCRKTWVINKENITLFFSSLAIVFYTFFLIFTPHGGNNALICTGELLACLTFCKYFMPNNEYTIERNKILLNFVFVVMSIGLVYAFIVRIDAGIISEVSASSLYYVLGRDKNKLGLLTFIYFAFCFKNKYYLGYLLALILAINCASRMCFLALLCTVTLASYKLVIKYFTSSRTLQDIFEIVIKNILKPTRFVFFQLIFLLILGEGFITWVWNQGFSEYTNSLIDGSNYMRMVANVYAFDRIMNDWSFIFWGLDGDIFSDLGIEGDDFSQHTKFLGTRLVAPHNDLLNMVMRSGTIYTYIYFFILTKVLQIFINNKDNIPVMVPFVFLYSFFLRPILCRGELVMIVFILSICNYNYNNKKLKNR